ncbi:MAG: basic amino acid ABC transporter substrate-binding protein [Eubacterium sp.]
MKKNLAMKLAVLGLCVVTAFAFTACGSSSSSSKSKSTAKKTYTVVTEPTFPPYDTTDKKGNLTGFDMDMVKAIAKDQDFNVKFKSMEFQSLIPAIQSGNADIIAAGMNVDKERSKKVDFTNTYCDAGLVVMVKKDNNTITGEDSLTSDMKVASQTGTSGATECKNLQKKGKIKQAVILDGFDTCIMQLQNGDVNAVIIDKPVAQNYMQKHSGKFKTVGKTLDAESYAMAVKKGNSELKSKLNKGLKNIVKNGKFQKICDKWGVGNKFASK